MSYRRAADQLGAVPPNAAHLITQVSGPPCAGKSTHATQHAEPDSIIDDVTLALACGGRDRIPSWAWAKWRWRRAVIVHKWTGPGHLYVIVGNPVPIAPGVEVVVLDPGPEVCHARADQDNRPPITHDWIEAWYARFRNGPNT